MYRRKRAELQECEYRDVTAIAMGGKKHPDFVGTGWMTQSKYLGGKERS
jgi:hypothetical protein